MKTRMIVVLCFFALGGCAAEPPHASGSFADHTFYQEIGKSQQPLFAPDCPVH